MEKDSRLFRLWHHSAFPLDSLADVAARLGITRSAADAYARGRRAIPPHIWHCMAALAPVADQEADARGAYILKRNADRAARYRAHLAATQAQIATRATATKAPRIPQPGR